MKIEVVVDAKNAGVGIHNVRVALFYNCSALLERLLALKQVYKFCDSPGRCFFIIIPIWNCELCVLLHARVKLIVPFSHFITELNILHLYSFK